MMIMMTTTTTTMALRKKTAIISLYSNFQIKTVTNQSCIYTYIYIYIYLFTYNIAYIYTYTYFTQLDRSCGKWGSIIHKVKEERNIIHTLKRMKGGGLVTFCVGTVFSSTLFKERQVYKWRKDKEEDIRSYLVTLWEREDTGNWNRKQLVALCREVALEEAVVLS
jgi:hypothetical protein